MKADDYVPGGWGPFKELTPNDVKIFREAMEGVIGRTFTPEKVAKQIVNGIRYRFYCQGKYDNATQPFMAFVTILDPIHERASITSIESAESMPTK